MNGGLTENSLSSNTVYCNWGNGSAEQNYAWIGLSASPCVLCGSKKEYLQLDCRGWKLLGVRKRN